MSKQAPFDTRLTPARRDIAAAHLAGQVQAARFVTGRRERVMHGVTGMRGEPSPGASLTTQALRGEFVQVYEVEEGWAWGQLETDGYVGYLPAASLAPEGPAPTHRVRVLSTFLYPGPSMKLPVMETLPLNALLSVSSMEGDFARVEDEGYVWAGHLGPLAQVEPDFVAVAERFIGAPYLWGGKTAHGVDCSGLVQSALTACGMAVRRDTDMQESSVGDALMSGWAADAAPSEWDRKLQRGDLVFWRGHVGIMRDSSTLLHANGFRMLVASEPLDEAVARIRRNSFGAITSIRRLGSGGPV